MNLVCDRCGDQRYSASPQFFTGAPCEQKGCGGKYVHLPPRPQPRPEDIHRDKGEGNHH